MLASPRCGGTLTYSSLPQIASVDLSDSSSMSSPPDDSDDDSGDRDDA